MSDLKILIADDDPLISDLIRRKLSRFKPKFDISVVHSGHECIEYLDENPVDCILSDYQMPGMDGIELLDRLRESGNQTPFIFVTGQGNEEVAREAFKHGASDYFTKEVGFAHFDRINNSIRQAVGHRRAEEDRARAESFLAEEKNKLDAIVSGIADGICIVNREYKTVYQNSAYKEIIGDHTGIYCYEFIQGNDRVCEDCPIEQTFHDGRTHRARKSIGLVDPKKVVDLISSPLRDHKGNVVAAVKVVRDVTERSRAEQEILRLSRQNRLMLESAGEGIYGLDIEGRMTFINKAALDMTGWTFEDMTGVNQHFLVHHSKPDGSPYPVEECPIYDAFRTGKTHTVSEEVFWRKDGTRFPIEYTSTPIVEDGVVTGAVVVFRDITERIESARRLAESERMYRAMFESNPQPMMVFEVGSLAFLAVNNAAVEHYGYSREEFLSMTIKDIRPPEDVPALLGIIAGASNGIDNAGVWRHIKKDGTVINVEVISHPIEFEGRAARVVLANDVTLRLRSEQAYEWYTTKLEALTKASLQVNTVLEIPVVMRSLVASAIELVGGTSGAAGLIEQGRMVFREYNRSGSLVSVDMVFDKQSGVSGLVMCTGRPYISNDAHRDPHAGPDIKAMPGFKSLIAVPILSRDKDVIGCFEIHDKRDGKPFDETDIGLLEGLAASAAVALENARIIQEHTLAVDALKSYEALNDAIVGALPDLMFVIDRDGRFLEVICGDCEDRLYVDRDTAIGKTLSEFFPEKIAAEALRHLTSALDTGSQQLFEYTLDMPQGTRDLEARLVPFGDNKKVLAVVRDVTERKNAEKAIRNSETRFRNVFENAGIGMVIAGPNGSFFDVNPAFSRFLGYTRDELLSKNVADITHPEDREESRRQRAAMASGSLGMIDMEKRYIRKDGATIWARTTVTSYLMDGTPQPYYIALVLDITDRKVAEEALKESETKYHTLMERANDAILTADADSGIILDANRKAETLFGRRRGELVGMHLSGLHPTAEKERYTAIFQEHIAKREALIGDLLIQRSDGATVPVEISSSVVKLGDRKIIQGIFRDITERKRAEEEKDRLLKGVSSISEGIAFTDKDGRYIYMNDAHARMFGYEPNELIGRTWKELVPPSMQAPTEETMRTVLRDREKGEITGEGIGLKKDGSEFPVEFGLAGFFDPDCVYEGHVCIARDITERKAAEEALINSRELYKEAEAIAKIGNWQWLIEKDEVIWSDGMFSIFGLDPKEFGRTYNSYLDFVHPDDIERVMGLVSESLTGKTLDYTTRVICPYGREKIIHVYGRLSYDDNGKPASLFGTVQDVTEQKTLEKQREDLFAMFRHDMKTPLAVITNNAEMTIAELGPDIDNDVREMQESIISGSRSLSSMLDDVVAISRLETGGPDVEKTDVDILDLLLEASVAAYERARSKGLEFVRELPKDAPSVTINRSYVQRAIMNLLDNAVKYTPKGGTVSLRAEVYKAGDGRWISISVADSGPGVPEPERERIFEKYYRSGRTRSQKGTGLGLSIVKAVAGIHGGSVELESRDGLGSTFTLRLPMS